MKQLNFIIFIFVMLLPLEGKSIQVDRNLTVVELTSSNVEVIMDPDRAFNIDNLPQEKFNYLNQNTLNFGFYDGAVWLKLYIGAPQRFNYILELKNPYLDNVTLFVKNEKNYFQEYEVGDKFPFSKRVDEHRYFHFPLTGSQTIIMRFDNAGDQFAIPAYLFSNKALNKRDYEEQFILGIYYGIILFVLLFNFFIYFRIQLTPNFYYVLYLIGLMLLQLGLGGHGFQYLWPSSPYLANHMLPIMASLGVFFLLLFVRSFLQLKTLMPRVNKALTLTSFLLLGVFILSCIPVPMCYKISVVAVNVITFILNIAIIPISLYAVKKKFRPARFFFLAFVLLFISVFIFLLKNFGWVASNFLTQYSLQIGSSIEVILLSFAIVDRFKMYKEEALLQLEEKNQLIKEQATLLEEKVNIRTAQLSEKSDQLLYKNKEILDSINYAQRIQDSVMPLKSEIEDHLNAFVFFQPKDIVSGDFYWINEMGKYKILALADCTGHGVPGAMLSILGINTLNNALKQAQLSEPAEILKYTNKQFNIALAKENKKTIRDGMDISICRLDLEENILYFSGANANIYVVRDQEIIQLKGDRNPIGSLNIEYDYSQQELKLQKNDVIYLFTDGYPDQFGGLKNKKLKHKEFKNLLLKINTLTPVEQHARLDGFMRNWKGNFEQIDDMSIIGLKI
ncbi:Serine phosphatase RsbU, regulator of sigma subunit [Lishizhenia tianjinensis]|uniref:Serine phosphatase RsbU, regulator of sigma subunit n=1 Tax=Lishizhenia tianjinensis TaxID=477690 RepID=A0A1I7BKX7_9FLAO|nr:7TM diverse intracellular signaling domain-containing protein [Lishizhenia tianjinensis]SFT87807.1 Serine phosphatase RsbU, regulator of sigma subunit [Lishizhenia tianjinensis]